MRLGAGADARKDIFGHEFGHVSENLNGVTETGNDNGAGVTVTDPNQEEGHTATHGSYYYGKISAAGLSQRLKERERIKQERELLGLAKKGKGKKK